ncbi:MAG TPA: DNA-formamidopyrimidine glycosylase family protein [Vicinamibacteria bacterium]|nr:DNA-formamidopyrimidine glycosylase family protein [Vicinamibacteria bacterium]
MPELPEVESQRRRIERWLKGRRIAAVTVVEDPIVFAGARARSVATALRGRRVRAAKRKGKHLWLELDRRPWLAFHFGMTGWFSYYKREEDRPRFWKIEIVTDDGRRVAYTDPRRFGRIRLQQDPPAEAPIALLGFDPLEGLPPARELAALLARRHAPLKAVLLDQALFAGVGNWIADEVLYQARLSPRRPASSLTAGEVVRLRGRLHDVVKRAVAAGADSDRFPRSWLFHVRWGRRIGAVTARDEAIVHQTIGGRTTAWVPSRQK